MNTFSYSQYSIISEADRVITFGGHCHYQAPFELDEVTEYKNDEWTLLGTDFRDFIINWNQIRQVLNIILNSWKGRLNRVRFGQASISNGLEVMILGGTPRNNHRPEM